LAVDELGEPATIAQQQERHHEHGHELDDAREDADGDVAKGSCRVPESLRHLAGFLLKLVDDVVLLVVAANRLVLSQVFHVARQVVRQVVHAVDDRRDDQEADSDDRENHPQIDDENRPRARHATPVECVDRWRQRHRQEDRHEEEDQDLPDQIDEVEASADRDADQDHLRDQAPGDVLARHLAVPRSPRTRWRLGAGSD
jgi:hypothetical protein